MRRAFDRRRDLSVTGFVEMPATRQRGVPFSGIGCSGRRSLSRRRCGIGCAQRLAGSRKGRLLAAGKPFPARSLLSDLAVAQDIVHTCLDVARARKNSQH